MTENVSTIASLALLALVVALVVVQLERTHRRASPLTTRTSGLELWSAADDRDLARTVDELRVVASGPGGTAGSSPTRDRVPQDAHLWSPQDAVAGLRPGPQDARTTRTSRTFNASRTSRASHASLTSRRDGSPTVAHRPRVL